MSERWIEAAAVPHDEFVLRYDRGELQVGMRHQLRDLAAVLPWGGHLALLLIVSPFLAAAGLCTVALMTGVPSLLLAMPLAAADYLTSTGRLTLLRALRWSPLLLAGLAAACSGFERLGVGVAIVAGTAHLTSILCSAGFGLAKDELERLIHRDATSYQDAASRRLILLIGSP